MLPLAIRHLLSRKRQTFLTLLGVLLGSMSYVVISGMFIGFQDFLLEQLINNDAHIHIKPKEEYITPHSLDKDFFGSDFAYIFWDPPPSGQSSNTYIEDPSQWYKRLEANPEVEAFSPMLSKPILIRMSKNVFNATLIGCDPEQQARVNTIGDSMVKGKFTDLSFGGNRIIIGVGMEKKLGARLNQTIHVSNPEGTETPFKIAGVFKTGLKPVDDYRVYTMLADAQQATGAKNELNDIAVRIKNYTKAGALAQTWDMIAAEKVESWDQINENFLDVFKIQNAIKYLMISVLLVVASFGIYNVLSMTVNQKRQEIAILRSMGFRPLDILWLFFLQGLILGIAGGLLGIILGYFAARYISTIPFGGGPFGGTGYLLMSLNPWIYFQAMCLALLSSCSAGFFPARAAGKMSPIEIIRNAT
ncbi:MAG: ABC transporter permease [Deltaproteobacteria bacterium]|nr:ABC transporter permease [Deltaproteobacteria bacterium]